MSAMRSLLVLAAVAMFGTNAAAEDKWGTVKGRVVFDGDVPATVEIAKAKVHVDCAKFKTVEDDWVVDSKTKGVRWVMVWLLHESGDFKKAIPIHPSLAKAEPKVVLDQPCCTFEPHALCMRTGQILVVRNSAKFAHNSNITGGADNPNLNPTIPPGTSIEVDGWKASPYPVLIQCGIHPWMNARIRVFAHPYFAVTNEKGEFEIKNASVGKYRIVYLHDSGWVVGKDKTGVPLEIKADGVTDVGVIKAKLKKD